MKDVFLIDDSIISPLGFTTSENLKALREGRSGLQYLKNLKFPTGGYYAGKINDQILSRAFAGLGDTLSFTRLEQMMILAISQLIKNNPGIDIGTTGLIISTTKGNIDILEEKTDLPKDRVYLSKLGEVLAEFFGFSKPIIVSNACISGGLALVVAKRLINTERFSNVIVLGGDIVSEFVVSGFQSFMALSPGICSPFSIDRNGINLGEAAAAVLVSSTPGFSRDTIVLKGEGSANDANHISGPSRTGEGLYRSIGLALQTAEISPGEIGYISAHGTGTIYNDEMEAIAFHRSGLGEVPVNSLKAYYGHTLGASALLESIITAHSLLNNEVFESLNFTECGTSKPLNIVRKYRKNKMKYAMKVSSGFGGCNLALIFEKTGHGI